MSVPGAIPASVMPASAVPASAMPASAMPASAKPRRDPTPNPGLNPDLEKYEGQIKNPPDEDTGFGFIKSPDMTAKFQRDAFLHNKNCPWIFNMDLKKDERVVFQVVLNER